MKIKIIKSLPIIFLAMLASCTSQQKQVDYFKQHPKAVQTTAQECISKTKTHKYYANNSRCMAVIQYEKEQCQLKQQNGDSAYQKIDCNDKELMMNLAQSNAQ